LDRVSNVEPFRPVEAGKVVFLRKYKQSSTGSRTPAGNVERGKEGGNCMNQINTKIAGGKDN
jgi:hypothetical protein